MFVVKYFSIILTLLKDKKESSYSIGFDWFNLKKREWDKNLKFETKIFKDTNL